MFEAFALKTEAQGCWQLPRKCKQINKVLPNVFQTFSLKRPGTLIATQRVQTNIETADKISLNILIVRKLTKMALLFLCWFASNVIKIQKFFTVILSPKSKTPDFSNQLLFHLEVREIGITLFNNNYCSMFNLFKFVWEILPCTITC